MNAHWPAIPARTRTAFSEPAAVVVLCSEGLTFLDLVLVHHSLCSYLMLQSAYQRQSKPVTHTNTVIVMHTHTKTRFCLVSASCWIAGS